MFKNLAKLEQRSLDVEHRIPMMAFKTEDDILQMKHFVRTYYSPILTEADFDKLDQTYVEKEEVIVVVKRDLS